MVMNWEELRGKTMARQLRKELEGKYKGVPYIQKLFNELERLEDLPRYNCFKAEDIIADQELDEQIEVIKKELERYGYRYVIHGTGTKEDPYDGEWIWNADWMDIEVEDWEEL